MKKYKLKKKNAFIALAILLLIIIAIINPIRIIAINKLTNMGYSRDASKKIIKYGLKSDVLNSNYNEFINLNVLDSSFNKEYYAFYSKIKYDRKIDMKLINFLKEKGYNEEETSNILNKGDIDNINLLLSKDKYENIDDYLGYSYAKLKYIDRYINYKEKKNTTFEESVIAVNLGLDRDYYTDYNDVNEFSYTMLVNKYNKLSNDFIPPSLKEFPKDYCSGTCPQDNKIVVDAFVKMAEDLKKEKNLNIYVNSAYRSYSEQEETYNRLTKLYGVNYDVAKAGFSEHQTGLAVDIRSGSQSTFKGSKEEKWLKENAYKYGFIFRYDSTKSKITGYNEPWHFRYVGDIAKDIYESKLTFDEYYIKYLDI